MTSHNVATQKIFVLSCLALTVTSMTFAIRAGILGQLGVEFGLTAEQLGWVNSMAFLGFPVATIVGGALYNLLGARTLLTLAFLCHLLGLILTIVADGFWGLMISTFLIGFANGSVEAGCNPLIAELNPTNKTTMLNRFHVWFPGGIVIGALASSAMTSMGLNWQWQVALIIIPTIIYGVLLLRSEFPELDPAINSTFGNLKNLFTPFYFVLAICFTFTATTELGTQQWIERILGSTGASPMLILAMITGVMAVGRFYAGPLVKRFAPAGILLMSSVLAAVGIFLMSRADGAMIYVAALLFAVGVTYFWPTMLGCVAEYTPKTGALGLSIAGGLGMFSVSMWNPVIGSWIDSAKAVAEASNVTPAQADVIAGQAVLQNLFIFPCVLIVLFTGIYIYLKKYYKTEPLAETESSPAES
jgi:MFS family permease